MDVDQDPDDTMHAKPRQDYGIEPDFDELDEADREVCPRNGPARMLSGN